MPLDTNIVNEEVADIITKVPHWLLRWGNFIILILIFIILFFSWIIKYPDVIKAKALITSKIPAQKIYAGNPGRIDTLLIKDGEKVKMNQVLGMIENSASLDDILILKEKLEAFDLRNNLDELDLDLAQNFSLGNLTSDYYSFEKSYLEYKLNNKLNPYNPQKETDILRNQEIKKRLLAAINQKKNSQKLLNYLHKDLKRHKILFENGVISELEFENKNVSVLQTEIELSEIDANISQLNETLNSTNENLKKSHIDERIQNSQLLKEVILSYNTLLSSIKKWELDYLLKSDIAGKISFTDNWKENFFIPEGTFLFSIVPNDFSQYETKIMAPAENSGKIKRRQKVFISLKAFPENEFGVLEGQIKQISATPNSEGNYLITVDLLKGFVTSYNIHLPSRNELIGSADIVTDDLRLIERILIQFRGLF